jgi:uncharacterized membrane protein (DUF2068 family)
MPQTKRLLQRPFSHSNRWLILIGAGQLFKGLLFISLGFGALHMVHRDLGTMVLQWVSDLRFDPEGRFVNYILEKVQAITPHRMKLISLGIFIYAAVDLLEGTGLVLGKLWAEYLTLVVSASLLPWELLSIVHKPVWPKMLFTFINILVVWYLAVYLRRRMREHKAARLAGKRMR